jgi:hypothetical protein
MNKKYICPCCGRQVVDYVSKGDDYICPLEGGRRGIGNEIYCGECSQDLDENGLFPEEAAQFKKD